MNLCSERLKDEVGQFIIFNSLYRSIVGQSDHSKILLTPHLFHNFTCILFSSTYKSM